MTDGTRSPSDAEGRTSIARFQLGTIVAEDRRGSRVGRIVHAWDEAPPVLYRLAGPTDPRPWIAWERHLRLATKDEVVAYEAELSGRQAT